MEGGGKAEAEQKAKAARKRLEGILAAKQRGGSEDGDEDSDFPWGKERPRLQDLQLSSYEQTIAMEVVAPEDISVKFDGRLGCPVGEREGFANALVEQILVALIPSLKSSRNLLYTLSHYHISTRTLPASSRRPQESYYTAHQDAERQCWRKHLHMNPVPAS
jgi:hypothetical protein